MSAKRNSMRKIREVLRLRFNAGLSIRQISASTKVSIGAIQRLVTQAGKLDLSWPLLNTLDDRQLAILFTQKPIPGPRNATKCRIGPRFIKNSNAKVSPSCCCGRNTPHSIRTGVTATPSSVTDIGTGVVFRNAPCASPIRRVKSVLWTTVARPYRSSAAKPVNAVPHRSSLRYWVLPTTPMLKPHTANHCQIGSAAMYEPSNTSVAHRQWWCRII